MRRKVLADTIHCRPASDDSNSVTENLIFQLLRKIMLTSNLAFRARINFIFALKAKNKTILFMLSGVLRIFDARVGPFKHECAKFTREASEIYTRKAWIKSILI